MARDNTEYTKAIGDETVSGNLKIVDDVIASIAGVAATEVEGVAAVNGNITKEIVGKLGIKNLAKGVDIDITEDVCSVSITLTLRYGYSIPKTSAEVQDKVKNAIESMTGLEVSSVDVRIAGITIDKA